MLQWSMTAKVGYPGFHGSVIEQMGGLLLSGGACLLLQGGSLFAQARLNPALHVLRLHGGLHALPHALLYPLRHLLLSCQPRCSILLPPIAATKDILFSSRIVSGLHQYQRLQHDGHLSGIMGQSHSREQLCMHTFALAGSL